MTWQARPFCWNFTETQEWFSAVCMVPTCLGSSQIWPRATLSFQTVWRATETWCRRVLLLDLGQVIVGSSQWSQFLYPPRNCLHTFVTWDLALSHTTRNPGPTGPVEGLTLGPDISSQYLIAVRVSLPTLQRFVCPSMDMIHCQWPITKPAMLNNFTSHIMFSEASPNPFMAVTCAQGELGLIYEKQRVLLVDLNNSCNLWQMPVGLHNAGQWAQGTLQDIKPSGHPH